MGLWVGGTKQETFLKTPFRQVHYISNEVPVSFWIRITPNNLFYVLWRTVSLETELKNKHYA